MNMCRSACIPLPAGPRTSSRTTPITMTSSIAACSRKSICRAACGPRAGGGHFCCHGLAGSWVSSSAQGMPCAAAWQATGYRDIIRSRPHLARQGTSSAHAKPALKRKKKEILSGQASMLHWQALRAARLLQHNMAASCQRPCALAGLLVASCVRQSPPARGLLWLAGRPRAPGPTKATVSPRCPGPYSARTSAPAAGRRWCRQPGTRARRRPACCRRGRTRGPTASRSICRRAGSTHARPAQPRPLCAPKVSAAALTALCFPSFLRQPLSSFAPSRHLCSGTARPFPCYLSELP